MRPNRGALLTEIVLALVVLGAGLAPALWVLARAERLVARARARELAATAGRQLLAELDPAACLSGAGTRNEGGVERDWSATGDTLRTVVAHVRVPGHHLSDTLATRVRCP